MFFKRNPLKSRPAVESITKHINKKSHKEKKYLSLMLVPSYSTGKTRTLRIPRVVFHGVVVGFLIISAVIGGLQMRARHFEQQYRDTSIYLVDTRVEFDAYRDDRAAEEARLIEATINIYDEFSRYQYQSQTERAYIERGHQNNLHALWEQLDELVELVRLFDEQRQTTIGGLSSSRNIPPVNNLLNQLDASQRALLDGSVILNQEEVPTYQPIVSTIMAGTTFINHFADMREPLTEEELHERIELLVAEIELQQRLVDDLAHYRQLMDPHIRNHPTIWPVHGRISSGFGGRMSPVGRGWEHHTGVDIPARTGTPVRAAGGGTVIFSAWMNGYGNTIIIDHGFGITTLYAHHTANRAVRGQRVERGDIIAYVGSTGWSTGPHLHYEVRINNRPVNPVPYLMEIWRP